MDMLLNNQISNYTDDPNRLWVEIDRGLFEYIYIYSICLSSLVVQVFGQKNLNGNLRRYLKCLVYSKKKQHQQHLFQRHLSNWQHFFKKGRLYLM